MSTQPTRKPLHCKPCSPFGGARSKLDNILWVNIDSVKLLAKAMDVFLMSATQAVKQLTAAIVILTFFCASAGAASKEEIQLQTQVQTLSDQLAHLQRSIDESIGLMNDLTARNSKNVQRLQNTLDALRTQLAKQNDDTAQRLQKTSSQVRDLNSALLDMKAQVEKAMQQPAEPVKATRETDVPKTLPGVADTSPATTSTAPSTSNDMKTVLQPTPVGPVSGSQKSPEDKMELYESGLESYKSKDYEAAALQFSKYLQLDRQSETANNAQFYLAQIEFDQADFEGALEDFTSVATRLSDRSKAATAQYKKALCLLEVERQDEAIAELQAVVQQYPGSPEARLANKKLRSLRGRNSK